MKVKELIEELKNYDGDMEILITSTDPTDYKYINDFGGINDVQYFIDDNEGGYLVDEEDYKEDYLDEDGDGKGKKVLVIDGGEC